jgi:hypothetical protein
MRPWSVQAKQSALFWSRYLLNDWEEPVMSLNGLDWVVEFSRSDIVDSNLLDTIWPSAPPENTIQPLLSL